MKWIELNIHEGGGELYPLIDYGFKENDALIYCYRHGFHWTENGVELYDYIDRVSCFCCYNNKISELRFMYFNLPEYWQRLKNMEDKISQRSQPADLSYHTLSLYRNIGLKKFEERFERELSEGKVKKNEQGVYIMTDIENDCDECCNAQEIDTKEQFIQFDLFE